MVKTDISAEELINSCKKNTECSESRVNKAIDFAKEIHKNHIRMDGKNWFQHCLNTAYILSELGFDEETIVAGILHNSIDKAGKTKKEIEKLFGKEISELVEGVANINQIIRKDGTKYSAELTQKIVLGSSKDIRVFFVKLADKLDNMRTIDVLPQEGILKSSETALSVYAPISHKIGLSEIESELNDLSFKQLRPLRFEKIEKRVGNLEQREKNLKKFVEKIEKILKEKNINSSIFFRVKNIYSINQKMVKKQILDPKKVWDVLGVRIICSSITECYAVLGAIYANFEPIIEVFDDYIAKPKSNGYQSIHVVVKLDEKDFAEIQIRTWQMHAKSEAGISAHWLYKQIQKNPSFDKKLFWIKQLLQKKGKEKNIKELTEKLKESIADEKIFVFTPKKQLIDLPKNSTVIDFAYAIHSDVGEHCEKAFVNGKISPLNQKLQTGDIIEILTSKKQKPKIDWLRFVKTPKAIKEIKQKIYIK